MIIQDGTIAVDLADVKAIRLEFLHNGGNLIFDFNNLLIPFENQESGTMELNSFPNDSISHFFETSDTLRAYFDEWVGYWRDSKN